MHTGNLTFPIFLQMVGIIVIILEFIIPSAGLLAIIAIASLGYSIYYAFHISTRIGMYFVIADLFLIPICIIIGSKLLANSPLTLRKTLRREDGVTSQDMNLIKLLGKTGVVMSTLRPAGTADIDGKRIDVVSSGEYIEKGCEVVVSEVDGNRVVVKKVTQKGGIYG
jgi:membrane-bound ClpP family serine protease